MADKKSRNILLAVLTAVAYIVIGILFIINKKTALDYIIWIAGIVFIVQGILDLIFGHNTVGGVFEIAIGAIILIIGAANISTVALIIFGVLIAANGVLSLIQGPKLIFPMIMSILTIVVGVLLVIGTWASDWLFIIIGISLIIDGVLVLLGKQNA